MRHFTELTALLFIFKVKDHSILQQLDLNTKIKMLLSPIENHCKKKKEYASALKIMHLDKFNVTYFYSVFPLRETCILWIPSSKKQRTNHVSHHLFQLLCHATWFDEYLPFHRATCKQGLSSAAFTTRMSDEKLCFRDHIKKNRVTKPVNLSFQKASSWLSFISLTTFWLSEQIFKF